MPAVATNAVAPSLATVWAPQPGPQWLAIRCPVEDLLYGGARGGGKTDFLLGDWIGHQAAYGAAARGILFRRTYPEMDEIVERARALFPRIGARYTKSERVWTFPSGARQALRYLDADEDADNYIGHQYTWMGFDQLERWPSPDPIDKLRSTLRSASGVPCLFRATANPGGIGHTWVKARYVDPAPPMRPFEDRELHLWRVFIPARVRDNQILLTADPGYVNRIRASGPPWLVRAWLEGDWDVVPGAFLEGVWSPETHVIDPFEPPREWPRWRALDWGFAKPYSVGWYTQDFDGVMYRYRELYGYGGRPNHGTRESAHEVARKIRQIEAGERARGIEFNRNPAGVDIWGQTGLNVGASVREETIASRFREKRVIWQPAKVGAGSRVQGAMELVLRLRDGTFKITRQCKHWLRTVPMLPPDPHNPEDVDTDAEDHCYDETRYSLRSRRSPPRPEAKDKGPKPGTFDYVVMMDERRKRDEQQRRRRRYRRL